MSSRPAKSKLPQLDALTVAEQLRSGVNQEIVSNRRSEFGQFMTPAPVARFMASLCSLRYDSIRLLDPGAAVGSLTAAFVDEVCTRKRKPKSIDVTAFEIDPLLASRLEQTLSCCRDRCTSVGIAFNSTVIVGDFIESTVARLTDRMFTDPAPRFTHVIMNPPYRKIRSNSSARRLLARVGIETSNVYAGFMALSMMVLEVGGEFVSITPRSFCNGTYFRSFRKAFLHAMKPARFHVFESRKDAFREDDVLQENIITYAIRSDEKKTQGVVVSSSAGPNAPELTNRVVPYNSVIRPNDPDAFIHLVIDERNDLIASQMMSLPATLPELGLRVSTGRVVDFRAREYLRDQPCSGTVPLIYPCNLCDGGIQWPKKGQRKPQAIVDSPATATLLVDSGYYVLVKRFSAKEERRRLVASVFDPKSCSSERVGFENHLNYYHAQGHGIPLDVACGLTVFLNASVVDEYFRQFNGHTQVNASDLRKLHYPSLPELESIGSAFRARAPSGQQELDHLVENEVGWKT